MLFLDMVNKILSAIDSQSVSSIDDSDEAEQVASIVQRAYYEILYMKNWSFLQTEGKLIPIYTEPNQMRVPDDCLSLIKVKYNKQPVEYVPPQEFRDIIDMRNINDANINEKGIYTDRLPKIYTSFDDSVLVFDSYDNTYSNLLESLSYCLYSRMPKEINTDNDEFDLPLRFQPVLLNYAISIAMEELKGDSTASQRYETKYKAGVTHMLKFSKLIFENEDRYDTKINYGRRGY